MLLLPTPTCTVLTDHSTPHTPQCEDGTFLDALGGTFSAASFTKWGLQLSNFEDKLPDPSIGITILVPSNNAWLDFLFSNGFFIPVLSSIDDKLVAIMTYQASLTALSPERIRNETLVNTTTAADGSLVSTAQELEAPTSFGLLVGEEVPVLYSVDPEDPNRIVFRSPYSDEVVASASAKDVKKICNSYVYVVDKIIIPAPSLDDVPKVEIPENLPWESDTETPGPSPETPPQENDTVIVQGGEGAPRPCDKTWVQVANENGLSLLATILGQGDIPKILPSPGNNHTLLAPTNDAFFAMLNQLGISIADASKLGDKLAAVLSYHVLEGSSRLASLTNGTTSQVPTLLSRIVPTEEYTISVEKDFEGKVLFLSGKFEDNSATITGEVDVCGDRVTIIDKVLVPAPSLDSIPIVNIDDIIPVQTQTPGEGVMLPTAVESSNITATTIAGYYLNCTLIATRRNSSASSRVFDGDAINDMLPWIVRTDPVTGTAELECDENGGGPCVNGSSVLELVVLPGEGMQLDGCMDSWSGLPPPFPMVARLQGEDGATVVSPLSTLLLSLPTGASAENASVIMPYAFGVMMDDEQQPSSEATNTTVPAAVPRVPLKPTVDYVALVKEGDDQAFAVQVVNTELINTVSIGGAGVCGLIDSLQLQNCTTALFVEIAAALGTLAEGESLADSNVLYPILKKSLLRVGGNETEEGDAVLAALATNIGVLNAFALQVNSARQDRGPDSSDYLLDLLAKVAVVAQTTIASDARNLGLAPQTLEAYQETYTPDSIAGLITSYERPIDASMTDELRVSASEGL